MDKKTQSLAMTQVAVYSGEMLSSAVDQGDKLAGLRARGPSTNLANQDGVGLDATITIFPVRSVGAAGTRLGAG